jgi:hypothetical protein
MVRPTGVKTHHFVLGVKTHGTRKAAELAVLASFAKRQPDGCEFYLRDLSKEEWMAGARSGMETALELAARSIENLRKTCGVTSRPNAALCHPAEDAGGAHGKQPN